MPTRLLKIDPEDPFAPIQLYETQPREALNWCSLSYVWGGDQPVKTTRETLAVNRRGISISSLPQTIKDAVTVSRRLGVYYLWIDCLCIIQDDSDDLGRELAVMSEIYKYAFFTISASCAKSSQDGFLQNRGYLYTLVQPFKLRYESCDHEPGTLLMFESSPGNLNEDPIESRCWTYQERLLSPRVLHYSTQHLRWQCRTLRAYDGGLSTDTSFAENEELVAHGGVPCIGGRPMPEWRRIVGDYSMRKLTYPKDKLIAMAAIAREFGIATQQTYLAGLWKESLPRDLCWHVRDSWPLSPRPEEYRAPSWSWAAVDGEIVTWMFVFSLTSINVSCDESEVLEATVSPAGHHTTYGTVESGVVVIKGKMKSVTWYYNMGKLSLNGEQMDGLPDALEDGWPEHEDASTTVWALLLLKANADWLEISQEKRCGLLLTQAGQGSYRRVGFFECSKNFHRGCADAFADFEISTIHII